MWKAKDSVAPSSATGETSEIAMSAIPSPKRAGRHQATGVPRRASVRALFAYSAAPRASAASWRGSKDHVVPAE